MTSGKYSCKSFEIYQKHQLNSKYFGKFQQKTKIQQFYSEVRNIQILDVAYVLYCLLDHVVHVTSFDHASSA